MGTRKFALVMEVDTGLRLMPCARMNVQHGPQGTPLLIKKLKLKTAVRSSNFGEMRRALCTFKNPKPCGMMTPAQALLWQKIERFELDEPEVDFKFSSRLARENGWRVAYAQRVILEYKRFLLLCCISPLGVTPSDAVDQAWHLHLTFTRQYWIALCQDTLGQQIHHNPTKGGQAEAGKFDNFYTHTRQLYPQCFGMAPPADIWPANETRFTDINFSRVNMGRYWLVRKPRRVSQLAVLSLSAVAVGLFIQGSDTAIVVAMMLGIIAIVAVAVYKGNDWTSGTGDADGGDSGCADDSGGHHGGGHAGGDGGHSGCGSGCSGCGSGCSGCGGH